MAAYPTDDFWYFAGDATCLIRIKLKITSIHYVQSLSYGMKRKDCGSKIWFLVNSTASVTPG